MLPIAELVLIIMTTCNTHYMSDLNDKRKDNCVDILNNCIVKFDGTIEKKDIAACQRKAKAAL